MTFRSFLFFFISIGCWAQQAVYVPDDALEALIEASCPEANNGVSNDDYVFLPTWQSGLSNGGDNSSGGLYYNSGTALLRIFDANLVVNDWTGLSALGVNSIVLQDNNIQTLDLSTWGLSALDNTIFGGGVKMEVYDCYSLTDIVMPQDTIYVMVDNCPSLERVQFQSSNVITALNINQCGAVHGLEAIDLSNIAGFNTPYGFCHVNIASHLECLKLDNGSSQCLDLDALVVFNYFYPSDLVCVEVDQPLLMQGIFPDIPFTANCTSCFTLSISEQMQFKAKQIGVIDLLGRKVQPVPGQLYLFIYNDGSVKKKIATE